jgi:hypothetical protein
MRDYMQLARVCSLWYFLIAPPKRVAMHFPIPNNAEAYAHDQTELPALIPSLSIVLRSNVPI